MNIKKYDYEGLIEGLKPQERFLFEKILYYHDKVSKRNNRMKIYSNLLKILVFVLAGGTTVVLGIENEGMEVLAKNLAIVFGALITLLTAVLSYFNIERFWMRSVSNHLKLNNLRDHFVFLYYKEEGISKNDLSNLFNDLNNITNQNIEYWNDVMVDTKKD